MTLIEHGGGVDQVVAYAATTNAYQSWLTSFPECNNGTCPLILSKNGDSCFQQGIACDGWLTDGTNTYTCTYGTHALSLTSCYIYAPTFNANNRANGHAYGDPATGAITGPQTSPSDIDRLTASLLGDTWVTTGEFAVLTAAEKAETAHAVATACLSQVGIAFSGVQQAGELPVVTLTSADCSNRSIFSPGNDVAEATVHDAEAIGAGQASVLHYESPSDKNSGDNALPRQWYKRAEYNNCGANYNPPDTNCDEYPYYSTMEGGPGASLKNIDATDNIKEGRLLAYFYAACGISAVTPEFNLAPQVVHTPGVEVGTTKSVGICIEP